MVKEPIMDLAEVKPGLCAWSKKHQALVLVVRVSPNFVYFVDVFGKSYSAMRKDEFANQATRHVPDLVNVRNTQ